MLRMERAVVNVFLVCWSMQLMENLAFSSVLKSVSDMCRYDASSFRIVACSVVLVSPAFGGEAAVLRILFQA